MESLGETGPEISRQDRFPHVEKPGKCISYLGVKREKMLYEDSISHFMRIPYFAARQLFRYQVENRLGGR